MWAAFDPAFPGSRSDRAYRLNVCHERSEPAEILAAVLRDGSFGRVALVSSFGTEAAVLLALAADIDRDVPVITIDTGKLFGETHRYRADLVSRLGLTNVRVIGPDVAEVADRDGDGLYFRRDADGCCNLRKVQPLAAALAGVDTWITGRKRYQTNTRAGLPVFEARDGRIKVNPLAGWDRARIDAEFTLRGLPRHPLEADGFPSVGCYTCTERAESSAGVRSGRWAGSAKTECGIHTYSPIPPGGALP